MSGSIFEPVKITWDGKDYEIPADRVMGLIERIEDHLSFFDLSQKNPRLGKIARAYGEALRYAGATVSDEAVYKGMFDNATGAQVQNAIMGLLAIMIPPEHLQKKTEDPPKEPPPPEAEAG